MHLEELKYPIGRFVPKADYSPEELSEHIRVLEEFPDKLRAAIAPLNAEQLHSPYRPGGWTLIQVVNHCADSHMNALIRVKLALTENNPTILPYQQDLWVQLPDGSLPTESALQILKGLHHKWAVLLKALSPEQWQRSFVHPEKGKALSLKEATASYAWHSSHHLAHVSGHIRRMGWAL